LFQKRPEETVKGCSPAECLIPEIASSLEENLRLCFETGKVHSYERSMDMPHGHMSVTTTLTPIVNRERAIGHIVGMARDITLERDLLSAVGQRTSVMEGIDATAPGLIYLFDVKRQCSRYLGGASPQGYDADEFARMGSRIIAEQLHPDDLPAVGRHLDALGRLRDGEVAALEYRLRHKDGHYVHCLSRDTVFSRDSAGEVELILGIAIDISEQKGMEQEVRHLSEQLVTMRSDERRRIAQDLHDSTGQHLIAAELALIRVQAAHAEWLAGGAATSMADALTDVMDEIKEAEREIRVLSFLLHPPSIETRRPSEAMRSLAVGFGSRAGIDVEAAIDPAADALPDDVAVSLFRVCQEALTNVHRHARPSKVKVTLEMRETTVSLAVADDGGGFDPANHKLVGGSGLGLSGMRDRMQALGGSLEIHSNGGTEVIATAPRDGPGL
jgi:signal transduction histidine kinase